ncbi:hypothetical protein HN865_03740 [Candidatus Woesearchaeota archaeon]|jgi:hypothetical protein|nr:hypothetical protein [Candidatus Woesearchaeota archaeon]MBT7237944.1 hypothetical protein [Candidatus Woesearchaeota archaeon]
MITFEQAQNNPELRQSYINSIDLGERGKYVSTIEYIPSPLQVNGIKAFMACIGNKKSKKPKILIPINPFHPRITEDDFLSTLKDHELIHAEQCFTGKHSNPLVSKLEQKLMPIVMNLTPYLQINIQERIMKERDAYQHQLEMAENGLRNISKRRNIHIKKRLNEYMGSHGPLKIITQLLQEGPDEYNKNNIKKLYGKNLQDLITTLERTTPEEQELIKTLIK